MARGHGAIEGRDAGTVGITLGMAQLGVDAGLEALGDEVLQALGLVVEFVQFIVEHAMQEGLDQSVVADNFEGAAAARGRKDDTAVALVFDQRILRSGELLQHVGDGSRGHLEALGKRAGSDTTAFRATEGKNGLQVVVDRLTAFVHAGARAVGHEARIAAGVGLGLGAGGAGHGVSCLQKDTPGRGVQAGDAQ